MVFQKLYSHVSNTQIQSVGRKYPIQMYILLEIPNPAPGGRTDPLQLTYIPQLLAEYINAGETATWAPKMRGPIFLEPRY